MVSSIDPCSTLPEKGRDRDPLSSNRADASAPDATYPGSSGIVPIVPTQQLGSFGVQRRRAGGTGREEVHALIGS